MSAFSSMHTVAERTIHGQFGDQYLHLPMARSSQDVSLGMVADTSRPADITFVGIYHAAETSPAEHHVYDQQSYKRPGVSAPRLTITVPSSAGIALQTGDRLKRVSDGVTFRVTNTFPAETGAVVADVNLI